jgi:hypothetical protein
VVVDGIVVEALHVAAARRLIALTEAASREQGV